MPTYLSRQSQNGFSPQTHGIISFKGISGFLFLSRKKKTHQTFQVAPILLLVTAVEQFTAAPQLATDKQLKGSKV
jgi:hypothetical protein